MSEQHPPPGGPWSDAGQPPPPGAQPPPYGQQPPPHPGQQPGWGTPPQPGMLGAAHKPGAIPLRPLGLGDMYDAAFRIVRFNPTATVGAAVLVGAVAMAIPVLVTAVLTAVYDVSLAGSLATDTSSTSVGAEVTTEDLVGMVGVFGSLGLGAVLQSLGLILVGGMIARVVAAAAIGRRLSLGEAWAATHGNRWRLVGLSFLLGLMSVALVAVYVLLWIPVVVTADSWVQPVLWGLISVPLFLAFMLWFWVRVYYLAVPALMLESPGVLGAVGRGFRLTRGAFWRTFGIALLTYVIAQIAGSMLAFPISLLTQGVLFTTPGETGTVMLVLGQALSSVITIAFVAPFTGAVSTLQYIDLRMRTEAYDVELMQQAGITRA